MRRRAACHVAVLLLAAFVLALAGVSTPAARAQSAGASSASPVEEKRPQRRERPQRPNPTAKEAPKEEPEADEGEDEKEEEEPDEWLAITGGTVHTVSGPVLHGATVLCKNDVIHAVGPAVAVPEGAQVIDASGYHVYPGLVAAESSGVIRSPDSADAWSLNRSLAMSAGITTAVVGNGAYKTASGTLEGLDVGEDLFESVNYSGNRPTAKARFREALDEARQFQRDVERYKREKSRDPDTDMEEPKRDKLDRAAQGALRLITGERRGIARAESADDLLALAGLAEQYGFELVIRGASEGWTVADELARAGVQCIVFPRRRGEPDDQTNRPNGPTIENARILHDHGVRIAVLPAGTPFFGGNDGIGISLMGLAGRDLLTLPMAAAFAVRGGLPEDAALRSISLDAARLLGIDHRVGSIEVGKDADFAIADGDLLHYMTLVRWTVINGKVAYDKQSDSLFDHIRPPDEEQTPPTDFWPRRLGEEWGGEFLEAIAAEEAARAVAEEKQAEASAEDEGGGKKAPDSEMETDEATPTDDEAKGSDDAPESAKEEARDSG